MQLRSRMQVLLLKLKITTSISIRGGENGEYWRERMLPIIVRLVDGQHRGILEQGAVIHV